ncbi:hypothetical protein MUK42_33607 [Musa troglodytarum]|uniref:Uncharacterized protein n=1 Tax=Musa troglodytarum TaxID=320322 RepID=A0A9E7GP86_9LILI|nr:hypothetical protein MUK42_33607 [Musa troglodytarum]
MQGVHNYPEFVMVDYLICPEYTTAALLVAASSISEFSPMASLQKFQHHTYYMTPQRNPKRPNFHAWVPFLVRFGSNMGPHCKPLLVHSFLLSSTGVSGLQCVDSPIDSFASEFDDGTAMAPTSIIDMGLRFLQWH